MKLVTQNGGVTFNNASGYGYSFWFYDPYEDISDIPAHNSVFLRGQTGGQISGVTFNQHTKKIEPRSHGFITTATSWYNPDIVEPNSSTFKVNYQPKKLNNWLFLKKNPTSMEFWFNGEKVAYNTDTASYYPDPNFDWELDPNNACNMQVGDLAYWDEDISDIAPEIYNKGVTRNWMNLQKQPKHYWRLGESSGLTTIPDIGVNGANHFVQPPATNLDYILASVNGTSNGYKFGAGPLANQTDPVLTMRVGDTISFTNNTGGHPLAIKDADGNDIATESGTVTTWTASQHGVYRYYCTAHPTTMGNDLYVYSDNNYQKGLGLKEV
jgi:hypothetical protein